MGYAKQILSGFGKLEDVAVQSVRGLGGLRVRCGTGVDPKDGDGTRCPVCGATGTVVVTPPVVTCLKCSGSGREGGDLSCLACRGIGVVSVRKEAGPCLKCGGTGEDGVFYCTPCKGQGIV